MARMKSVTYYNHPAVLLMALVTAILMQCSTCALSVILITLPSKDVHLFNRTALIVLATASCICALCHFSMIPLNKRTKLIPFTIISSILLTGATSYYMGLFISGLLRMISTTPITYKQAAVNNNLVLVHLCILVPTVFVTGICCTPQTFLLIWHRKDWKDEGQDSTKIQNNQFDSTKFVVQDLEKIAYNHKTIPMKCSSLTLTPEMDFMRQVSTNWMNEYLATYPGSDTISTPSVVKHSLVTPGKGSSISRRSVSASSGSKGGFRTGCTEQTGEKNSIMNKIQRKITSKLSVPRKSEADEEEGESQIDAKYVTRLSTIQGTPMSVQAYGCDRALRSAGNGIDVGAPLSPLDRGSPVRDNSRHMMGLGVPDDNIDAAKHYTSILIPPCLSPDEGLGYDTEVELSESNIDEVADDNKISHTTSMIGFQEWNNLKEELNEIDTLMHSKSTPILRPAFSLAEPANQGFASTHEFKQLSDFSFPKSYQPIDPVDNACLAASTQSQSSENSDSIFAVNLLEMALQDAKEGNDVMTQGLRQESPAFEYGSVGGLHYPHHSPSKSIYSASSFKSGRRRSLVQPHPQHPHHHSRSESQFTLLYNPHNAFAGLSTQSSPIKNSKLKKRLSHKFSKSVLSFKWEGKDAADILLDPQGKVIDLSYVHHLQSKHAPSRSVNTLGTVQRRSSASPYYTEYAHDTYHDDNFHLSNIRNQTLTPTE